MHAQDGVLDSFLFLSKPALLPSMGIASPNTTTYPCTLTPAPPSLPFQLSSASPTNTPPQRTANNRALLPTRAAGKPGVCVHPSPFAAHGDSYHRTERPCRVHGFTASRRGYRSRLDGDFATVHHTEGCIPGKGTWLGSLYEY